MADYSSILEEAQRVVNGARHAQYGPIEDNFAQIAAFWEAYKDVTFTPHDVALMMILLKIARASYGTYKRDTAVDIAGYAECYNRIMAQEHSET